MPVATYCYLTRMSQCKSTVCEWVFLCIVIHILNHKNIHISQHNDSHCSYNEIMICVTYTNNVILSDILLQSGSTPLHAAAVAAAKEILFLDNEQVIKILVKAGADVNATDKVSYYSIIV